MPTDHSDFPVEVSHRLSGEALAKMIILGIFLSLLVVIAVAGNILVIIAIVTDRSLRKTCNYFLVSLAVADALVAVAVMSFAIINDTLGRWPFGPIMCEIWISSDVMCSTASILNLCAISLDRYVHIRDPLRYPQTVTQRRVFIVIAIIWITSALISFLPIHLGWHKLSQPVSETLKDSEASTEHSLVMTRSEEVEHTTRESEGEGVSEDICAMELNPLYAVLSSAISFYLPCLAMIVIYVRLYSYARRHAASIRKEYRYIAVAASTTPQQSQAGSSQGGPSSSDLYVSMGRRGTRTSIASLSGAVAGYKLSDHKAAVTLGVIMGVFLVCWTPFFTVNAISSFCAAGAAYCVSPITFAVTTWLGYANSTMNPVIYSIFNKQFREAFRRIIVTSSICRRLGRVAAVTSSPRKKKENSSAASIFASSMRRAVTSPRHVTSSREADRLTVEGNNCDGVSVGVRTSYYCDEVNNDKEREACLAAEPGEERS